MLKYILILLTATTATAQLEQVYLRQAQLTNDQIKTLSIDKIESGSDYQKALAHFNLAYYARVEKRYQESYNHLISARENLSNADTVDHSLMYLILLDQGYLSKKHNLYKQAISKYEEAMEHAVISDERNYGAYKFHYTSHHSLLYNLARSYKHIGKSDVSLKLLHKVLDETKEMDGLKSRIRAKSLREIAMLYKEMEYYKESNEYFEAALFVDVKHKDRNKITMWIYHDWASLHHEQGNYKEEERLLRKALDIKPTFTTKLDLGNCLKLQGKNDDAITVLKDAETEYNDQVLNSENIMIYKLLHDLTGESKYSNIMADEFYKYTEQQKELDQLTKSIAFSLAIQEMEDEIQKKKVANKFYNQIAILSILIGTIILIVLVNFFIKDKKVNLSIATYS